jgi:hypothetical protein
MKRAVAILALLSSAPVHAQFFNGNNLMEFLREKKLVESENPGSNPYRAGMYPGYVVGVYEALVITGLVCTENKEITIGQISSIIEKHLEENPARWSEPAFTLATEALVAALPCPPN